MGKLNQWAIGVQRFYHNNVDDNLKHLCIKILLGKHAQQTKYGIRAAVEQKMTQNEQSYTTFTPIRVGMVTWNLAGQTPYQHFDIANILLQDPHSGELKTPEILVVAFQEMVKLNVTSIMKGKDLNAIQMWTDVVLKALNKSPYPYVCVSKKAMVG